MPFKEVNLERDPEAAREVVRKTRQTGCRESCSATAGSWGSTRSGERACTPKDIVAHQQAEGVLAALVVYQALVDYQSSAFRQRLVGLLEE